MSDRPDDELQEIEDLLRSLPLRPPSDALDERVAAIWMPVTARSRRRKWAAMAALATVAATLLVVLVVRWQTPEAGPGAPSAETIADATSPRPAALAMPPAVRIERVWSAIYSKQVVLAKDASPVERVQRRVVRQIQWNDGPARMEWIIPTHETKDVPLEYN